MSPNAPCPCGSRLAYSACCAPLHQNTPAPNAERLMRSRYSAFCLGKIDYLLATLAPQSRQPNDAEGLRHTIKQTQWLALQVLGSGTDGGDEWVEFVAFYQKLPAQAMNDASASAGKRADGQLHERSRFIQQDGRWFYLDGRILPPVKWPRNDPCWCGSGIKFKKCCGA